MKVVNTTTILFVLWLSCPLYWTNSQCALSHLSHPCHDICQERCLINSCFKNTHKNIINPKVWHNNFNVHFMNTCPIKNNGSVVVTVDACVFCYACPKCLVDVWNVLTNHNMHKNTYNQFVNINMKTHVYIKCYYHRKNASCTCTNMMLEHANHFFFHSRFLGGPQLNLCKGIREKKIRSMSHSKLKYKTFVCFAYIGTTTITPTS